MDDPIVNEVRRVRDELSKKFNYNIDLIFDDLLEKQKKDSARLINLKAKRKEKALNK